MSAKIIFLLFFSFAKIQAFTTKQLKLVKSVTDEYCRKHIIIVKNLSDETEIYEIVKVAKYFSNYQIYTSWLPVNELDIIMYPLAIIKNFLYYEYRPRTIVLIDENDFPKVAKTYLIEDYEVVTPKVIWLTIGDSFENLMGKMNESYIPYDCQILLAYPINDMNYGISEVYQVNYLISEFNVSHFGYWNENDGLDVPIKDFYARRFNLNGTSFGAAVNCRVSRGIYMCDSGDEIVLNEIVNEFSRLMNFRLIKVFVYENDSFNKFDEEYPYFFVEFFINSSYIYDSFIYDTIEFTIIIIPIWSVRYYLHLGYNKEYEKGDSSPFIRPFSGELWLCIVAWICASTVILIIINYGVYRNQKSRIFELLDACFASFESFTSQCGSGTSPEAESSRLATFLIQIPPLFLVLAYSGIIISFITIRIIQLPINNLEELVEDGTFNIGYAFYSYPKLWFQRTDNPIAKLAHEKLALTEEDMPRDVRKGVKKICEDFKFSYIAYDDTLFINTFDCQPLQVPTVLFVANMGMNLRVGSPYKNIFSRISNSIRSTGVLKWMRKRIVYYDGYNGGLAKNTKNYLGDPRFEVDTVDWDSVKSVFIFLGLIHLISMSILLFEGLAFHALSKRKNLAVTAISNQHHE